jgi:hypothetical protein
MKITLVGSYTPDELREVADLMEEQIRQENTTGITTCHGQHSSYSVRVIIKSRLVEKITVRNEYRREDQQ